jgi:hypothetical protein
MPSTQTVRWVGYLLLQSKGKHTTSKKLQANNTLALGVLVPLLLV